MPGATDAPRPRRLWHYTCGDHGHPGIVRDGLIRPNPGGVQALVSALAGVRIVALPVIWLTDVDVADADDAELLGLGTNTGIHHCDRVAYRFRAPATSGEWWPTWAARAVRDGRLDARQRVLLEMERAWQRWWVSETPIRGPYLDERYRPPAHDRAGLIRKGERS